VEEAEKYFQLITEFGQTKKYDEFGRLIIKPAIQLFYGEQTPAYVKLWQLLEKQARYNETEAVIKKYARESEFQSDNELNEFYRRMADRFPDNGEWVYRLGNLLYKYAPQTARLEYLDSIAWFPLMHKEMFIDSAVYMNLDQFDSLQLHDLSETGAIQSIKLTKGKVRVKRKKYEVPGTGELILSADFIYMPRMDGIAYLQRAAALIAEKETLADIHFKTGNIYLWAGSKKMAYPFFEKSLSLIPDNANARLTLVDIYNALHKNRAAFNQLIYLNDSNQVNLPKRILFARYNILAGNFDKANESLDKTESYVPYNIREINNLRGLAGMLANKPTDAIVFYKKSIEAQKADPLFTNYSLARLYAKTGNTNEALKYLDAAIKSGFTYSYVLQNDIYMESLRKTTEWQTMIANMPKKTYKKNKL
jgi:tetratricopeptide (TPR) repeat protein